MGLGKRELSGGEAARPWVKGGLDFGYGPVEYAFFEAGGWADPILRTRCDARPVIAVNSRAPLFSPLLAAAMKGIVGICVSRFDSALAMACGHASYMHRPGAVVLVDEEEELPGGGEEMAKWVDAKVAEMEERSSAEIKKTGGTEAFFRDARHVKAKRPGIIPGVHAKEALEEALVFRYLLGKDIDVFLPGIRREQLGHEWQALARPDFRLVCSDEIFYNGREAKTGSELKRLLESGELEIRPKKTDALTGFVPKRKYFEGLR